MIKHIVKNFSHCDRDPCSGGKAHDVLLNGLTRTLAWLELRSERGEERRGTKKGCGEVLVMAIHVCRGRPVWVKSRDMEAAAAETGQAQPCRALEAEGHKYLPPVVPAHS